MMRLRDNMSHHDWPLLSHSLLSRVSSDATQSDGESAQVVASGFPMLLDTTVSSTIGKCSDEEKSSGDKSQVKCVYGYKTTRKYSQLH